MMQDESHILCIKSQTNRQRERERERERCRYIFMCVCKQIYTYVYIYTYIYVYMYRYIQIYTCNIYKRVRIKNLTCGAILSTPLFPHNVMVQMNCMFDSSLSGQVSTYRVAKTHRMSYLHRSFSAKEPCNQWLFCGIRPAT